MKLAVCAIFKDESPYLMEWLAFHHDQGVEQFYLYDHESSDSSREVLAAAISIGAPVEIIEATGSSPQMPCYSDCLVRHREDADWIAFIDLDEFLFSPIDRLSNVLDRFSAFPAVVANWAIYGTGGHDVAQGSVVESYLHRAAKGFPPNAHVKSIVQPSRTLPSPIFDPHSFLYMDGRAVNTRLEPVAGPHSAPPDWSVLRVNHYWSKSVEEATRKSARGRADCDQPRTQLETLISPECSAVYDDAAVRCLQSQAA